MRRGGKKNNNKKHGLTHAHPGDAHVLTLLALHLLADPLMHGVYAQVHLPYITQFTLSPAVVRRRDA